VDLAAGGKNELARFRARTRGDVEEGRRRAQQAYATLAADIIPAPALVSGSSGSGRRSRASSARRFYLMNGMEQKRRAAHIVSRPNSFS
jgi:hypothetical protein